MAMETHPQPPAEPGPDAMDDSISQPPQGTSGDGGGGSGGPADAPTTTSTSPEILQPPPPVTAAPSGGTDAPPSHHDSLPSADSESLSSFSVGLSVDTDTDDGDGFSDIDAARSSISIASSVYHFVEEFGRIYHKYKEGKYYLPNDEQEQNRLDLQHSLALRLLDGKLHLAPLEGVPLHRALDIGTGTGIWAIEFAEQHPEAEVIGTDLSPIQPEYVPPNLRFEIDDAEDDWVYNYRFDYIHGRYILPFVADIPKMLRNVYESLNPGGYVEIMETLMLMEAIDASLEGTAVDRWGKMVRGGLKSIGKDPLKITNLKHWLADAGFVNVTEKKIAVPSNPWAKGAEQKMRGALMMTNLLEVAQGITMNVFTKVLGWAEAEVEVFLVDVRAALKNRNIHAYVPVMVVWAQKPAE